MSAATTTVLVLEDHPALRELAREVLEDAGCEVLVAADGAGARARWAEAGERVGVIVADLELAGGESGLEVARELAGGRPRVGLVVTSGHPRADVPELHGGAAYLMKPYDVGELVSVVGALSG